MMRFLCKKTGCLFSKKTSSGKPFPLNGQAWLHIDPQSFTDVEVPWLNYQLLTEKNKVFFKDKTVRMDFWLRFVCFHPTFKLYF